MIGHDGNQRAVIKTPQAQPTEQFAHRGIFVGNLAVVGRGSVLGLVGFGRVIGVVCVVEMHPDEERPFLVRVQPCQRVRYDFAAAAFNCLVSVFSRAPTVEARIVDVKSTLKAGGRPRFWVEDQRADKRRRMISAAAKDVRSIWQVLGQRHAKIVYLMELGIRAREDGGMGRRSQRNLRVGVGKNDRLARQSIEVRSEPALRAQKTHAVRSRRIQRDQNDIGRQWFGRLRRGRTGHCTYREADNAQQAACQKHRVQKVYHRFWTTPAGTRTNARRAPMIIRVTADLWTQSSSPAVASAALAPWEKMMNRGKP